ncbi:FG-GAP-like repeat-containing protein [Flavobacterium sp. AC]|uniref:FG-GAP-like repeat-containing protein n=1 Tax=Flavobacterium azizsancarii TaxID=2961580 RepID=A0ABT4WH27_9FLAO|nr:FG-GAP-like repeat-containing protein [Flavobacterium azizsancarii]
MEPQISISYNSQGSVGAAGYGWNISGISSISRIPATKSHDGIIDGVDFNAVDRFAIDGQRLVLKNISQTYGADGTEYETEIFSNIKVKSYGVHPNGASYGPAFFLVEYPDGSKAYYGNSTDSRSVTEWSITSWENVQGIKIIYNYNSTNNLLEITSIKYGFTGSTVPINEIKFIYESISRPESYYVGGQNITRNKRLLEINTLSNNIGFRNYFLEYLTTSQSYNLLWKITEKNGDKTKSLNPTVFSYENTDTAINYISNPTILNVDNLSSLNASTVTGDFDGDGSMDFILYPLTGASAKKKMWMFSGISPNTSAQTMPNFGAPLSFSNTFDEIFAVNYINYQDYLMPLQGWTVVQGSTFTTYAYSPSSSFVQQDQKTYTFPRFILDYNNECGGESPDIVNPNTAKIQAKNLTTNGAGSIHYHYESDIPHAYISGDFNGDGLTDIVAYEKSFTYPFTSGCSTYEYTYHGGQLFFINLDKRLTTNYTNTAGNLYLSFSSKIFVADFNGDGKSDIYVFDSGSVNVYTLDSNNQFTILAQAQLYDSSININRPIIIGDYNGDGKSDFMLPVEQNDAWYLYKSTGTVFIKEYKIMGNFILNDPYNSYNYFASDYDNDGKSDLTIVQNSRNSSTGTGTIKITAVSETQLYTYTTKSAITTPQSSIDIYALPIFLPSTDKKNPHFEIAFINNNKLHFFNSPKNTNKDRLLKTITYGNGVQEFITYQSLDPIYEYSYNSIYNSSLTTEKYPYFDIVSSPDFQIVTLLEKKSASVSKMKRYGYYGAVTNLEGLGFQGFRSIMETNWYDNSNPVTCTISSSNIRLRGAETDSYFLPYLAYPYRNFSPSSYTTKSTLSYTPATADLALQGNKVFKIQNTGSITVNTLDNTSAETTNIFDSYSNITYSKTETKEGSSSLQTNETSMVYETPVSNPLYILGRPSSKTRSSVVSGHTMTSNESYTYNSSYLLSDISKSATGTSTITEHFDYDSFGNITKRMISSALSGARSTWFEYDTSGRFMTKKTDNDALISTFEYYLDSGLLKKETNPYAQSVSYTYDSWFKRLTATDDLLNKTVTTTYSKSYSAQNGSQTTIATTTDVLDGSSSEDIFDDLGRKIRVGTKDINGTFSYVSFVYDIYDRNYKISEPYFGASASQWNETKFDIYSRPIENTLFNGRTTTALYEGLATTITDGANSKKITKNAIGNIISSYEPTGGTIAYSYFANGNLRQTNYNGVNIVMEQDGWGRKTKLTDPSAGVFNYKYNDFNELTEEKSQNGNVITSIIRDTSGRPLTKTIAGGGSSSETTYEYDGSKLPVTITYEDKNEPAGSNKIVTTIIYDNATKRATSITEEKAGISKFTRSFEYDALGRISIETKTAQVGGKTSAIVTKNEYKNGELYKILDANNNVLWQVNTFTAKGQIKESVLGNGIKVTNNYDSNGYLSSIQHDKTTTPTGNILTLTTLFDKNTDNLDNRVNSAFGNYTETFKYDDINRLKKFTNKLGIEETQNYDASGKISSNNLGSYEYEPSKPYQNTSITLAPEGVGYYANREGIFNDSMEDKNTWGPAAYPDNSFYTYDNSNAYTGATSLKMTNSTSTEQYVHNDKWIAIDNEVPTEYTYSAWVYSEGPQAEIFLIMRTPSEAGYFTDISNQITNVTNQWYKIEKTVLIQPNIKKLNIRLDNNGYGNMWYDDVQIRKTSDTPTPDRKLNITYNAFKSPILIDETGVDKINFLYNDNNQRSMMFYGSQQVEKMDRPLRKYYSADGSMEVKQNTATGNIEFLTYIGGDGYSAPIAVKSDGINSPEYLYLHRDYQGSILAVTDSNGSIVEKRLFDASGSVIQVQDGAGNHLAGLTILDRGYTGHEHLQSIALINMNARLYDPMIHRFLQVDNIIQDPTNTQNYNQYGYVLNNPLLYTDPSGNLAQGSGPGKDCVDCGWFAAIANGVATIAQNWDNWRIKDWANRNLNFNKWDEWRREKLSLRNIFGGGHKNSGPPPPPPNMSNYVSLPNNISYTSTHQTGKKGQWNSNLGDQFKLKTYVSLRIGTQKMFDVNDTFFNGKDEGRNYQFNLGRYNLNFRPKDNRLRFMWPSDQYSSQGTSFGMDGIGYHYNVRGLKGKSAGFDAAFRPGGHTVLLVGKFILGLVQPQTIPLLAEETTVEAAAVIIYTYAF